MNSLFYFYVISFLYVCDYRHGVFVEEAANNHFLLGNECSLNEGSGIHVWCEAVKGSTTRNVFVVNNCLRNGKGLSVGARSSDKTTEKNMFFNNRCRENSKEGLVAGNSHSHSNSFAHSVSIDNETDKQIKHWGKEPERQCNFIVDS